MATTEERAQFRRQVGDAVKADADAQTANGTDRQFALRYNNLFDELVQLDGVEQTTGYELDGPAGLLTFDTAPDQNVTVRVGYKYAAYTDTEADDLIDTYGVAGATAQAIKELLANAARLFNYQQGATKAEKAQIFKNMKELLKIYQDEASANANNGAGAIAIGKRTNEQYRTPFVRREDLSRTDQWGG